MHDRVTKAILPAFEHIPDPAYREIIAGCWARAAIEAMREPTDAMVEAALRLDSVSKGVLITAGPYPTWEAMIDAALNYHSITATKENPLK